MAGSGTESPIRTRFAFLGSVGTGHTVLHASTMILLLLSDVFPLISQRAGGIVVLGSKQ